MLTLHSIGSPKPIDWDDKCKLSSTHFQIWDWWNFTQHVWMLWWRLLLWNPEPADKTRRGLCWTHPWGWTLWGLLPLNPLLFLISDWLKKKSQQLSWLCVKAWAACKFCERHEFERSCMWFQWMERGIPGCRCWCVKEWDLYVFRCFPAAKAVSVWAFTHSYLFVVSYCLVQCQTFFLNPND